MEGNYEECVCLMRMKKGRAQTAVSGSGPRWAGESGFTLIEVLIALAILGLVGGAFLQGMAVSNRAVMVSQERVAAESLAKSQMENTKAQDYVPEAISYSKITIPSDLAGQGYDIDIDADPLDTPDGGIQEITVAVTRGGETLLTLVDYKVDR